MKLLTSALSRASRETARRLTALLAVAALLLNGLFVQTHVDVWTSGAPSALAGFASAAQPDGSDALEQGVCQICQVAASARGFGLATGAALRPPTLSGTQIASPADAPAPSLRWSHHWRSRAPPSLV